MLVRSSVNQGPSVGEYQAPLRQTNGATVHPGWNWADPHSNFAAQVQQVLREDCNPDAEFFVRWWAEDAVSAADDLLHRHRIVQERERQSPSSMDFSYFSPSFSAAEFLECQQMCNASTPASHVTTAASPGPSTPRPSAPGALANQSPCQNWQGDWPDDSGVEFDPRNPLTIEQARRVLRVQANSTPVQIKSAYRHLVRIYHPDRFEGQSSVARQTATNRMMAINRAYNLLAAAV